MPRHTAWNSPLPTIALVALALTAHGLSVANGLIEFDDTAYTIDNRLNYEPGGLARIWTTFDTPQYYPLTFTSHWLDARFDRIERTPAGPRPIRPATGVYHAVNVLLHAINVVLLFHLSRMLGLSAAMAFLSAAIFAVHPINVLTVTWIAQRKTLLSTSFALLTLMAWMRWRRRGHAAWYGVVLLAFAAALLSKSAILLLPLALLAMDLMIHRVPPARSLVAIAPLLAMAAAAAWITTRVEQSFVLHPPPPPHRPLIAAGALWFYLFKLLLPLRLSPLYPVWSVDAAQPLWWAALVSWIVVAGLLVRARARISGRAWFALIFALLMLLPTLGFVPFGNLALTFVSDQYLYLPAIGVLWLIAGWADARRLRTGDTPHPAWRVVPGLVLLCFTGGAMAYTTVFKNPTSVWTYTLKRNPDSYVAHVALGREALKSPHPAAADSAATHFMRATEIEPDEHPPYLLLFEACKRLGRLDDAEATIERLAARPHTDDVCARLHGEAAALLLAAGRPDRAAAQFESAIALRPDHAMNYVGLAEIHRAASRFVESVNLLRRALERDPDHLAAMHLLARVLATARDPAARNGPESLRLAGRVCDLTQFADWRIVDTLAAAQAECGDFASAIGSIDQAAQLAAQAGNQAALPILARMRALYEQGRPLRETRTGAP